MKELIRGFYSVMLVALAVSISTPAYADLLMWFKLDEGAGTSVADSSGNGYTGTILSNDVIMATPNWVTNCPPTSVITNSYYLNQGASFSGQYRPESIIFSNTASLNFGTEAFSVGLWWMPPVGVNYVFWRNHYGLQKMQRYDSTAEWALILNDDNGDGRGWPGFAVCNTAGGTFRVRSSSQPTAGLWHHAVGVRDGNNLHIYVDGVLVGTTNHANITTLSNSTANIRLGRPEGREDAYPWQYFGTIAYFQDARIFNHALSDVDVREWYQWPGLPIGLRKRPPLPLVLHLKMDDGDGRVAADWAGGRHFGTFTEQDAITNWASGVAGSAVYLGANGNTSEKMKVPYFSDIDFGNTNFSVSIWVNYDRLGSGSWADTYAVSHYSAAGNNANNAWVLGQNTDGVDRKPTFTVFYGSNYKVVSGTTPLNTNTWYHLVAVRDGDQLRLYVNGSLVGTASGLGSASLNSLTNKSLCIAGIDYSGTPPDQSAQYGTRGRFDDLQIYRIALTDGHVAMLYNNPGKTLLELQSFGTMIVIK